MKSNHLAQWAVLVGLVMASVPVSSSDNVGNGGDPLRPLFSKARIRASAQVLDLQHCSWEGEDVDLAKLSTTLAGRVEKLKKGIGAVEGKLANQNFVSRADPEVVAAERSRMEEMTHELELLERNLAGLS